MARVSLLITDDVWLRILAAAYWGGTTVEEVLQLAVKSYAGQVTAEPVPPHARVHEAGLDAAGERLVAILGERGPLPACALSTAFGRSYTYFRRVLDQCLSAQTVFETAVGSQKVYSLPGRYVGGDTPARRANMEAVVGVLLGGEKTLSELVTALCWSHMTVRKTIYALEEQGTVVHRKERQSHGGPRKVYRLNTPATPAPAAP